MISREELKAKISKLPSGHTTVSVTQEIRPSSRRLRIWSLVLDSRKKNGLYIPRTPKPVSLTPIHSGAIFEKSKNAPESFSTLSKVVSLQIIKTLWRRYGKLRNLTAQRTYS